jgi:uncharacterized protein YigA (DUF484 family)
MERAESLAPELAAAEAVKAYLRLNRGRLNDAEMMALLLPERFGDAANIHDYQRFVIDRLLAENAALKAECSGLRRSSDRASLTREGVRRLVLQLIAARGLADVVAVATEAAETLGADQVSLGIESQASISFGQQNMCILPPGLADSLIAREAAGALLKGLIPPALFPGHPALQSVAAFRLRLGARGPSALYAVGSENGERFDDDSETREIAYFVRALERAIAAWLEPPRS